MAFNPQVRGVKKRELFEEWLNEVSSVLKANEFTYNSDTKCAVKSYATNQLAANAPLEDARAEAKLVHTNGMIFGVYDGHGGASCARVLAKRLFNYIALPLLTKENRKHFLVESDFKLIEPINDLFDWRENRAGVYERSLQQWASSLDVHSSQMTIPQAMRKAFEKLDADIGKAAEEDTSHSGLALGVAMSGAVACVAVVSGTELHVAYAGDCQAVLGQQGVAGEPWKAKKLTVEHTCDNNDEVNRIKMEHPVMERHKLIQDGRLFQSLVPLRAFGDYRYKWTVEQLEKIAVPSYGRSVIPPNYYTPPYLTVTPEVKSMKLTENDKFLVIASDGLFDVLSPEMVVQLVGDHMSGKGSILKLQLHKFKDMFPLKESKNAQELLPVDKCGATHLIRAALGGGHEVVSKQLSFPREYVRIIRDDMTVTVIHFDTEFIKEKNTEKISVTKKESKNSSDTTSETSAADKTNPEAKAGKSDDGKKPKGVWEEIEPKENLNTLGDDLDEIVEKGGIAFEGSVYKKLQLPKNKGHSETSAADKTNPEAKAENPDDAKKPKRVWEEIEPKENLNTLVDDLENVVEKGGIAFKETVYTKLQLPKTKGHYSLADEEENKLRCRKMQLKSLKPIAFAGSNAQQPEPPWTDDRITKLAWSKELKRKRASRSSDEEDE